MSSFDVFPAEIYGHKLLRYWGCCFNSLFIFVNKSRKLLNKQTKILKTALTLKTKQYISTLLEGFKHIFPTQPHKPGNYCRQCG